MMKPSALKFVTIWEIFSKQVDKMSDRQTKAAGTALLGDEAVALGAMHAGLSAAYGYPGTPSTEILEYLIEQSKGITEAGSAFTAKWCSNEKTAMEAALGASFAGKRALVTMKHVGLNVAADPFINSALVEINGGLVVAVADDPGMHSSQGEQDSRFYAAYAMVPCLEPRNQQEAYDMCREAFELSEKFHLPVLLRLVTRLSHARAAVKTIPAKAKGAVRQNPLSKTKDKTRWMLLPAFARRNYVDLVEKQKALAAWSSAHSVNKLEVEGRDLSSVVITSGLGGNYYDENLEDLINSREGKIPAHLHIGAYPIPADSIVKLCGKAKRVLVIEEGQPFIEERLRGILPSLQPTSFDRRIWPTRRRVFLADRRARSSDSQASLPDKEASIPDRRTSSAERRTLERRVLMSRRRALRGEGVAIAGKLDGSVNRTGELDPDSVRKSLGLEPRPSLLNSGPGLQGATIPALPGRPPQLCQGCPHGDSYQSLNKAVAELDPAQGHPNTAICSDIGCYSLGATPPYSAIESIVCMGASVGMARGAAEAGIKYAVAVIGDSTFLHSGITGLVDAAMADVPMTVIILDNSIVAMTGCQETIVPSENLANLILGLGVKSEHLLELEAKPHLFEENTARLKKEMEYRGLSVVIFRRVCIEAFRKQRLS